MNKFIRSGLLLAASLTLSNQLNADVPNTEHPTTFLGPTARLQFTNPINNYTAYSLLGEAGVKDFRVDGTLGWALADEQRLKISAEYLTQRLTYAFFSGNKDAWVEQGALGAGYQYILPGNFHPNFDLNAYVSYAPNKSEGTVTGNLEQGGVLMTYTDYRRIAGSKAGGVSPGVGFQPWWGANTQLLLNYDDVHYNTIGGSDNHNVSGLGGTITFTQSLTDWLSVNLNAAVRKPFNDYSATLAWFNIPNLQHWSFNLFGDYTVGKNTLPNSYNVGLGADYLFECPPVMPVGYKGEVPPALAVAAPGVSLVSWTAASAAYMPQVLAIPNDPVSLVSTGVCMQGPPVLLSTPVVAPFTSSGGEAVMFSVANSFANTNNSNYSIRFTLVSTDLPSDEIAANTFTIDNTGTVTYHNNTGIFFGTATYSVSVILTGPGSCGSVTATFPVTAGFSQ